MLESTTPAANFKFWLRRILPNPLIRAPRVGAAERSKIENEVALAITVRQGEGSVLLSAGRIDMTGVDYFEDEVEAEKAG